MISSRTFLRAVKPTAAPDGETHRYKRPIIGTSRSLNGLIQAETKELKASSTEV